MGTFLNECYLFSLDNAYCRLGYNLMNPLVIMMDQSKATEYLNVLQDLGHLFAVIMLKLAIFQSETFLILTTKTRMG